MCILKIHAGSHSANAIQSAFHNLDTNLSDLETLKSLLLERGHDITALNLAAFHVQKAREIECNYWRQFVSTNGMVDSPPIGAENMGMHHTEYGDYFVHGDGRMDAHDLPPFNTDNLGL